MATLLLVEDHPLFCEGFALMAQALAPDWAVRSVDCADAACATLAEQGADVVIVDAGLPGRDGFTLMEELAAIYPHIPLMLISAREDAAARMRAQACGAAGFIGKREPSEAMIARIAAVLGGGTAFDDAGEGVPNLTGRQLEVLELLALGHGNKEIRHRLGIAERTVRAHLTELFVTLGAQTRVQAILRARELGLIA
ncbi:MAG TPA: response regulator transcription factor [Sphingomonas sp.]|uniref:response regulator transcription factor n=1 Tax=Sphingomonas sp. TaxID=28214 RepID=UPI002CAD4469|nr:response regulator transcription factor [Sphingomonas sp.]HMI19869.1 response regulator transcription factor [Sphingomonas sp.]